MPVYPKPGRGKGAWQVVIYASGKRHDRTFHGKKAEAEAFEARERVRLEVGEAHDVRDVPKFSSFCVDRYKPHAQAHLRASTWNVRRYHLATLIDTVVAPGDRTLGDLKLSEIRTEHVERYKERRRAEGRKPRSINNELAVLQAVRTHALELGLPIGKFKVKLLPVVGRGRVTWWDDAQLARLFASLEQHVPELVGVAVFLANTGCRKGEALAAEKTWINRERDRIEIPVNEVWAPKDNEPREIPISDALRPWIDAAMRRPGRWLFPSSRPDENGKPQRFAYWPRKQFDRARKLAGRCKACTKREPKGLDRCSSCVPALRGGPHTLRHTFASHFLRAQPDLFLLAKVLGHSHERTTKTYAHLLPDHLARAKNVVSIGAGIGPAAIEARRRWAR